MRRMHRTQIYLDHDLNMALDQLAEQRGMSKAGLLRLTARRLLEEAHYQEGEDPILGLIGLGHGGQGCASVEHDRVLAESVVGDLGIGTYRPIAHKGMQ